jgi:hypothetical protein
MRVKFEIPNDRIKDTRLDRVKTNAFPAEKLVRIERKPNRYNDLIFVQ